MRVVSWNIQHGVETELAISEIAASAELRDHDILLLQEMDEAGTAVIADAFGAGYAYTSASPHAQTGRDFGNSIVTRWPIRRRAEISLPHRALVRGQPRSATHAVVDVDGQDVSVYSVHTEIPALRLARRVEQFAAVALDANEAASERVVVGGDFNTVTQRGVRALTEALRVAQLIRVSSDTDSSYRRGGRDLALDHIFAKGFDASATGVLVGTAASDHDPLWVELVVPDDPQVTHR